MIIDIVGPECKPTEPIALKVNEKNAFYCCQSGHRRTIIKALLLIRCHTWLLLRVTPKKCYLSRGQPLSTGLMCPAHSLLIFLQHRQFQEHGFTAESFLSPSKTGSDRAQDNHKSNGVYKKPKVSQRVTNKHLLYFLSTSLFFLVKLRKEIAKSIFHFFFC